MKIKEKDIKLFLEKAGWANAEHTLIAADASFRRYERLSKDGATAILMLAPPKKEATAPFISVGKYLIANGFSAPAIKAMDTKVGLLLLEDFGDKLLKNILEENSDREVEYYTIAVELLIKLQNTKPSVELSLMGDKKHKLASYDHSLLMREADLFNDWYLEQALGINDSDLSENLSNIWSSLFKKLDEPSVMTLRDFHSENIMVLLERKHTKKIGLLDFQDAVIGHRSYDLVSLLQDARRLVSPELEQAMINKFLSSMEQKGMAINKDKFIEEYNILGAQRNAKIIGIFTRLWKRDKKKAYLKMIPHVWDMLERNLKHPTLKPLKNLLDTAIDNNTRQQIIKGR